MMITRYKYKSLFKTMNAIRLCQLRDRQKPWVTFGDLFPCTQDDPIQIYLKYKRKLPEIKEFNVSSSSFEHKDRFFENHKDHLFFVSKTYNDCRFKFFDQRFNCMDSVSPDDCVNYFSVPIFNYRMKLKMMIDMIARKDFLSKLDPSTTIGTEGDGVEKPYRVVCLIQSKSLSKYQEYKAHFIHRIMIRYGAFIDLSVIYFFNTEDARLYPFHIDSDSSKQFQKRISKDIRWTRHCMDTDVEYQLFPPSHPYLYPNMKMVCDNPLYQKFKEEYAYRLGEITLLYRCHPQHRWIAHERGVYSFMDPNFDARMLVKSDIDIEIIHKSIELYRSSSQTHYISRNPCFPNTDNNFFIDFETLDNVIYMIGIGEWTLEHGYRYRSIVARAPTVKEQERIMMELKNHLSTFTTKTVYYWSAEQKFWNRANNMNHTKVEMSFDDWIDLCRIFSQTPILIKNCFNFKLKPIAKEMKRMKMIDIECPELCSSGYDSITIARRYYRHYTSEDFRILEAYNHFDCTVMYEILEFLKKNVVE